MVARTVRDRKAASSSLATPTTNFAECIHSVHSVFYICSICACAYVETDIKTRARLACRSLCRGTSEAYVPDRKHGQFVRAFLSQEVARQKQTLTRLAVQQSLFRRAHFRRQGARLTSLATPTKKLCECKGTRIFIYNRNLCEVRTVEIV